MDTKLSRRDQATKPAKALTLTVPPIGAGWLAILRPEHQSPLHDLSTTYNKWMSHAEYEKRASYMLTRKLLPEH
jgi:hypothetical protein